MSTVETIDRKKWNEIVIKNEGSISHSWEWARAKEACGEEIHMFLIQNNEVETAIPVFVRKTLKTFKLGWIPNGIPYCKNSKHLIQELKSFAKEKKLLGLLTRVDYQNNKFANTEFYTLPLAKCRETFVLNLEDKKENLFNNFNRTTRKHIKRAAREEIQYVTIDDGDIERLWHFYTKHAEKKGFKVTGTLNLLKTVFELCNNLPDGMQIIGIKSIYKSELYGFMIAFKFGKYYREFIRADRQDSKIASYAAKKLSWEHIKKAKQLSAKIYDFAGVNRKKNPGVFNYKRSFGGQLVKSSKLMFLPTFI